MKFPVKFILPSNNYKKVSIYSEDFPQDIDKNLYYCDKKQCFCTTLSLPVGVYHYRFKADNDIMADTLRTTNNDTAILIIGAEHNSGVIFDLEKSFVKNNHLVLIIGIDFTIWKQATLTIQTLQGMKIIRGKSTFVEGSYEYQMFVLDIPQEESLLAFFELVGHIENKFYGENGLKDTEWAVQPFEIKKHLTDPIAPSNINCIYNLYTAKSVTDFEKHSVYFEKFPIDYITGEIPKDSPLRKQFTYFSKEKDNLPLTCLLRDIFLETEDFNPSLGLLGRFAYEYRQDIASIPFSLSDNKISFWNLVKRDFKTAAQGIGFQLLGSMTPEIIFGEEIGLIKTGQQRQMIWTKTKWNKQLYYFYQKLLKLRKKYPVLRQGRFRFAIQDCYLWGIERYMDGEDSIFIFANHSSNNIIIDLTKIMDFSGPIIELLTDHSLKRKKACTIFGNSLVAFKQNSSKGTKHLNVLELEDDEE